MVRPTPSGTGTPRSADGHGPCAGCATAPPPRVRRGRGCPAVDQQRIDVQRTHFGDVGGQLCQLDQRQCQCALVGGRHIAIGLEDARGAGLADQLVGQAQVQRRQRQRLVIDDFNRGTATADHDHRAERRVIGNTDDQLARLRANDGRLHQQTIDARIRPQLACTRQDRVGRALHRRQGGQVQAHAVHFRLVRNIRRESSARPWHRVPAAAAPGPSPVRVTRMHHRRGGNAVGLEQFMRSQRVQLLAVGQRGIDQCTRGAVSTLKSCGRLGGVSINAFCASR